MSNQVRVVMQSTKSDGDEALYLECRLSFPDKESQARYQEMLFDPVAAKAAEVLAAHKAEFSPK